MVLVELLKGALEVSGFSVLSAKLGKPITLSPLLLSTLPFGILVLLDRLGGALDVTGFSVMSSELGKSVVLSLPLLSILSCTANPSYNDLDLRFCHEKTCH